MRGAWIEICNKKIVVILHNRRSPCGERGLKSSRNFWHILGFGSLPVRGAWIEIGKLLGKRRCGQSLPVRGAWIEIKRFPRKEA